MTVRINTRQETFPCPACKTMVVATTEWDVSQVPLPLLRDESRRREALNHAVMLGMKFSHNCLPKS